MQRGVSRTIGMLTLCIKDVLSNLSIAFLPDFVVESSVFNVVMGEFVVETFSAIYEID